MDTTWDAKEDACDRFNLKVLFTKNPDDAFRVEVRGGECDTLACPAGEVFEWGTDLSTDAAGCDPYEIEISNGLYVFGG